MTGLMEVVVGQTDRWWQKTDVNCHGLIQVKTELSDNIMGATDRACVGQNRGRL